MIQWVSKSISRGEAIIVLENKQLFLGTVLHFQKSKEKTKGLRSYYKDYIDLTHNNDIYYLLDPLFRIDDEFKINRVVNNHKYFIQSTYICHVCEITVDLNCVGLRKFVFDEINARKKK